MNDVRAPRVFVSYAHESDEHREAVRVLRDWLLSHGVDARTDHAYEHRPPELGWQAWMLHEIEDADVVLIVCSPRLKARYEKREPPETGKGATYEGAMVTQHIYNAAQRNTKFYPLLPDHGDYDHVPLNLQPWFINARFPSGNARLLTLIREEVQIPKPDRAFALRLPGELAGASDSRLNPQETKMFGREPDVARVVRFLEGAEDSAIVSAAAAAQVVGTGGIGKTEVCKAALRRWLAAHPSERTFFVIIPEEASAAVLVAQLAAAVGVDDEGSLPKLLPRLPAGLYYLDNLEAVVVTEEGRATLRQLREAAGIRVLVSSRISLPRVLGEPIEIDALPPPAAIALFRHLWPNSEALPEAELARFIREDLGCHALCVALVARLGDARTFTAVVRDWKHIGTTLAQSVAPDTRLDSVEVSIRLTSQALRAWPGALELWMFAALYASGVPESFLDAEALLGIAAPSTRAVLAHHHVWSRRGDRFYILPPLARFAIAHAHSEDEGFSWKVARQHVYAVLQPLAALAGQVRSTDDALDAKRALLGTFDGVQRFVLEEVQTTNPDAAALERLDAALRSLYPLRPLLSLELLYALRRFYVQAQEGLGQATTLQSLGELERLLGKLDVARAHYDRALDLNVKDQSRLGQANALQSLGVLEQHLGRLDVARAYYDRALELSVQEQSRLGQANTLRSLGDLEQRLGKLDVARAHYDRALELYVQEQYGLGQANTLRGLGDLEQRLGKLDVARAHYDRALALYVQQLNRIGQATTLQSLGDLEQRLGKLDVARAHYDRALELYVQVQSADGQAAVRAAMAELESASSAS